VTTTAATDLVAAVLQRSHRATLGQASRSRIDSEVWQRV
jgi:hypothetical protein